MGHDVPPAIAHELAGRSGWGEYSNAFYGGLLIVIAVGFFFNL